MLEDATDSVVSTSSAKMEAGSETTMRSRELIAAKRNEILQAAARYGARNVRVFGSIARGQVGPESDIDFLVDLEPSRSLLDHVGLKQDLEGLLGRPVDVVVEGGISPHLESRILAEAVPL